MMTHNEFMEYFMGGVYVVGCFTKEDYDAFMDDLRQCAESKPWQIRHHAGFSAEYPYLFWKGNKVFGAAATYAATGLIRITYEEYLDMISPTDISSVNLEEVL